METIVLRAHFDGEQILLDDPIELQPNTRLLVTVIPEPDAEQIAWLTLSVEGLSAAYGESEPDYPLTAIKEPNPTYEIGAISNIRHERLLENLSHYLIRDI